MASTASISKSSVCFSIQEDGLKVEINDYDARPTLLSHRDLAELGLRLRRGLAQSVSMVQRQEKQGGWPGQFEAGPAITDPAWAPAPGRYFGDVYLAPCRSGVEVHIDSYDAGDQVVGWASLAGLGIERLPHVVALDVVDGGGGAQ